MVCQYMMVLESKIIIMKMDYPMTITDIFEDDKALSGSVSNKVVDMEKW